MAEPKKKGGEGLGGKKETEKKTVLNKSKQSNKKINTSQGSEAEDGEVLLKVGPLKYKLPGKRQRIALSWAVVGLNLLLVLAVVVYFYNPSFQQFIYNVGR